MKRMDITLQSGKIELPHPTEMARARIMQIHSRKMNVDKDDTNFEELARCCDDFNGAQCKAICVEVSHSVLESKIFCHCRLVCWHYGARPTQ
jgi:ATP-dependent 26S proteasome regulatory subunit